MIGLLKYLDIEEIQLNLELNNVAQMSKETFKHIVNKCATEKAFKELHKCKGKKNIYEELAMQNYLMKTDIKISLDERKWLFKSRMDDIDIGKLTILIFCCCRTKAIFLPLNKKKSKN